MPRTASAEREARAAEIKRQRNRSVKSATKTMTDKAYDFIETKDLEKSKIAVRKAISQLDKAVKAKVIHPSTAARRKSNLMRKLNAAFGIQTLPSKPKVETQKAVKKSKAEKE